jgi:hypothetical protein
MLDRRQVTDGVGTTGEQVARAFLRGICSITSIAAWDTGMCRDLPVMTLV